METNETQRAEHCQASVDQLHEEMISKLEAAGFTAFGDTTFDQMRGSEMCVWEGRLVSRLGPISAIGPGDGMEVKVWDIEPTARVTPILPPNEEITID